jgi:hypothetical protein
MGKIQVKVCVVAELNPDFVSSQIMKRIGAPYSHAIIIYKNKIYHAIEQGVCISSMEEGLLDSKIVDEKDIELDCTEEEFFSFIEGAVGKNYSEIQLLGFIFPSLKGLVANGRSALICSEFVAWVLEKFAGYKWNEDLDFVDPRELFESIK